MRLKLIACEVIRNEINYCAAECPHVVDAEFTAKDAHADSAALRRLIQSKIDEAERTSPPYAAVLLGYGLCGNAAVGLKAGRIPLIIPRAHDCGTLFLGSRQKYEAYFSANPSTPFCSAGYCECGGEAWHESSVRKALGLEQSYETYVAKYGEENAGYLFATLAPYLKDGSDKLVFIDIPEMRGLGWAEKCRARAEKEGKEFVELQGGLGLLRKLVAGEWDGDFLLVKPGQTTEGVYDWEEIIRAV